MNASDTAKPTDSDSSKVQHVRVSSSSDGQRIDNFLMRELKGVPRSRIYRIIRRGEVRINKKRCKPETKLTLGDDVRIPPFTGASTRNAANLSPGLQQMLLERILFENEFFMVLNKPSGLAVHMGTGIRLGVIEAMRQIKPEWSSLELAHRLDRDTSGCLIIAKEAGFLRYIQDEFRARTVQKHYLALVHGSWPDSTKEIDAPLLKNSLSSGERIVKVDAEGKASRTEFRVLERFPHATVVEAMPATGRTHQIRVHCQYGGHPIVGDAKYGPKSAEKRLKSIKNLCLHAWKIRFSMPDSGKLISVEAPLDKTMAALIRSL